MQRGKTSPHPTDLKLLRMCQKMVNMSVQIECSHCNIRFLTTEFYDHLKDVDPELRSNKSDSNIKSRFGDRRVSQKQANYRNYKGLRGSANEIHTKSAQALVYNSNHSRGQSKFM